MAVGFIALATLVWTISVSAATKNETEDLDLCMDHGVVFERVFAVPHESTLLHCELVMDYSLDYFQVPYNVTWYDPKTGLEFTGEDNNTLLRGPSLLFFRVEKEHQGHYLCLVRTPDECYKQVKVLMVEEMMPGECRRPQAAPQGIQNLMSDNLGCPLIDYSNIVDSYSILWYKGCELLHEGSKFTFIDNNRTLNIYGISPSDAGFYTCRMTFKLAGVVSVVSETINCHITVSRSKKPKIIEPTGDTVKVLPGSMLNRTCRVYLPAKGIHTTIVTWEFKDNYISLNTSERIHQQPLKEHEGEEGWWLERTLVVSKVLPEDFNLNFTCNAFSHRGSDVAYFTLHSADPDLLLPFGLLASSMVLLFILGLLLYRVFKVELVLLFRTLFPFFYASTDGDGKLYDAYVVYPQNEGDTLSEAVEAFAMKTLPQVLEGHYGYRLFILGRDSLPGQAIVDVVEEKIDVCRRLLLLYTSSSVSRAEGSSWFEHQAGLHRAIMDESLPVMLLEMEQLSDPSILPESLRLLRDKQGAVQAWKKKRRWSCTRMEEARDDEKSLSSFSLSACFWRKVRYHMPVRGKAKHRSKRKLLLNV